MTLAMVMLFAGCGGGSSSKSAPTLSVGGANGEVIAKEREFRTVIPPAYTNYPNAAQYWARGPEEAGFVTSLVVVREKGRKGDIKTYVRRYLRLIRHAVRRLSHLQALSVDGQPAFAMDWFNTGTGTAQGKEFHVRQVLVKHGPWVFFIRDFALPRQYAASLGALDEVIRHWHWQ